MDDARGRSEDIETRLKPDWWKTIFDATYLVTDADAVENDAITKMEVSALVAATGLKPRSRYLDLCCGQGRHVLELARRGHTCVTGVDGSAFLVEVGRTRAQAEGLDARLEVGDVRQASPRALGRFDCVTLLGNSFGYLPEAEDDLAVLHAAKRLLAPCGLIYLDVADGDWLRGHFNPASWEWVAKDTLVCRERKLSGDRLISREIVIEVGRGVREDRTYAERLYTSDQILGALTRLGFQKPRVVDTPVHRGMDPGMMGHRFTVVAKRPEERVTVLFGDPRLPDPVKPTGGFDQADMDTVKRAKEALTKLPGRAFRWADNHHPGAFVAAATGRDADIVLNLCDEGYRNDARAEATVPALLDALGVPYTGAAAGCLTLCYDKSLVRAVAARSDVPVPAEKIVLPGEPCPAWSRWPALVKPNAGDSSVGITAASVVHDQEALIAVVADTLAKHGPTLVQEFLDGPEFSVALVGNPGIDLRDLPVLQVDYSGLGEGIAPILGYESKWTPGSPWWDRIKYVRADATKGPLDNWVPRMIDWSKHLFERLGCRDYARFDWRASVDGVHLLEVNPNPGWCWDGKVAMMAEMEGLSYEAFLGIILDAAARRVG